MRWRQVFFLSALTEGLPAIEDGEEVDAANIFVKESEKDTKPVASFFGFVDTDLASIDLGGSKRRVNNI